MSIEAYLAINLLSDAALLGAVSRSLGMFNPLRLLLASSLCAAYSVAAAACPAVWELPPMQAVMLFGTAALLCGGLSPRPVGTTALSICAAALLAGGAAWLIPLRRAEAALPCALAGGLTTALLFRARPPRAAGWQVRIRLAMDGRVARFDALIDTGNRLREPVSGLPVLVAEAGLLKRVLPEDGYRVLRFGAVGGDGRMACFKPNSVWIERGRRVRRAPEVWVGVAPKPLPGRYRALAPCEFVQYVP